MRLTVTCHFTVMVAFSMLGLGSAVAQDSEDIFGTPPGVAPGEKYDRVFVTSNRYSVSTDPSFVRPTGVAMRRAMD